MNRPIKFRAWDFDKKVFIPTNKWAVVQTSFGAFGMMLEDWENYLAGEFFYSNTQALMQFTGLHDRNGREIYEGDILSLDDIRVTVTWDDGAFQIITSPNQGKSVLIADRSKRFEIIGNIYETPELIP